MRFCRDLYATGLIFLHLRPSEGRSFCLSFVTVLRQARKELIHIHTHTPLFVHCTSGSKNSPGESISSKICQYGMPPQILLSSLCLTHILSNKVFIGQKSWPHKCSFYLSCAHTQIQLKASLMCEKIPDSVTAWPFTFIWPHKMKPPVKQTAEEQRVCVWACVCARDVASVFIANIYRRPCWTLLFSRLKNFCGLRSCVHC